MKKLLALILSLLMIISVLPVSVFAATRHDDAEEVNKDLIGLFRKNRLEPNLASESSIISQINNTYSAIRSARGKSYNGYCGAFVADQLNYMGIGYKTNGGSLNGNKWYYTLIDNATTDFGYKQIKYGGSSCLTNLVNAYGNDIYNVVVSFTHQYG